MNTALPDTILKNTFSLGDMYTRADLLGRFFEHLFFGAAEREGARAHLIHAYYQSADPETQAHADAIAAWGDDVLNTYTAENLYERVHELKQAAEANSKIVLYVPVRLSTAHIERIGVWCRTNVQPNIILDLKVDPSTVGGCAFAFNNLLHDVSLSYFVKKQRPEMLKILHAYDK